MKEQKLKTWHIILLIIIALTYLGLKLWQLHWPEAIVELKGQKLQVLVAKIPQHQYKGLGGRESLAEYDGMLFIYPEKKKLGIVMRDMEFPIDIVWLDSGVVIDLVTNVPLEEDIPEAQLTRYYPRKEVNLVLELPAGWVEKHDVAIGDRLILVED